MGFWAMLKGEEPNPIDILVHYKNPGQYGEYATEYAVAYRNIPGYGKTVRNVYLPNRSGTSELDVLLIHEKGIFVFESKNYSGQIFGSARGQNWIQVLPNGEEYRFYNPIKQNETHCGVLASFLGIPRQEVYSYIVFSQRCELKEVPQDTNSYTIVQRPDLLKTLRRVLRTKVSVMTRQQVNDVTAQLKVLAKVSTAQKRAHVEAIKAKTEGDTCPSCGKPLVLRDGKYGAFYGCSAYPKCRFTRNVK